jgi:hypothetical protein
MVRAIRSPVRAWPHWRVKITGYHKNALQQNVREVAFPVSEQVITL